MEFKDGTLAENGLVYRKGLGKYIKVGDVVFYAPKDITKSSCLENERTIGKVYLAKVLEIIIYGFDGWYEPTNTMPAVSFEIEFKSNDNRNLIFGAGIDEIIDLKTACDMLSTKGDQNGN
jgi:hypothetical protein